MSSRALAASPRILLVEDSLSIAALYRGALETEGYGVVQAATLAAARGSAAAGGFDTALLDLGLPDGDGLDLLREWRAAGIEMDVIVVTANASIGKAVQAVREGAYDYLVKPVSTDRLLATLRSAGRRCATDQAEPRPADLGFIGISDPMREVYRDIRSVSRSRAPVFVTGESGTGKELCAEAVHRLSDRSRGPFVALNCGAIPRELMESELFGHIRGSFTGAVADRDGAARRAHRGTLFLDEICELAPPLQTKLLRFLQSGCIQRVGASESERTDVRIVCATNRSPDEEVRAGRFRNDLFYRLHVLPVHMPPLRVRGDDVLMLARHFLAEYTREERKRFSRYTTEAETALVAYSWPGNVRELQNVIRRAVVFNDGDALTMAMLGQLQPLPRESSIPSYSPATPAPIGPVGEQTAELSLQQIERRAIESAIRSCGGSITRAAKVLRVSPSTLYRKRDGWRAASA